MTRCPDSGAVYHGELDGGPSPRKWGHCGCCGKPVDLINYLAAYPTLAVHGDRKPCLICGLRSWRHAESDHPAGCLTQEEFTEMHRRLAGPGQVQAPPPVSAP